MSALLRDPPPVNGLGRGGNAFGGIRQFPTRGSIRGRSPVRSRQRRPDFWDELDHSVQPVE
ncbi:hypothetical protein ACSYDW_15830 [Paeniglutamicibacter sp. R2-26]|uniref:hypothetical protein n=1 Tax=Paeniglutamicibacter sp. R2-26 TaxID=3144417 RepID=UPI003EE458B5